MILGFLLLFLATSGGIPLNSPLPVDSEEHPALSLFGRQLPECIQPTRYRTTSEIIWSCIGTIFACTWVAIHPNLPGPYDSGLQLLKRRITIAIVAIMGPEFIVFFASRQWESAKKIKREFNEKFNSGVDPVTSLGATMRSWLVGPPVDEVKSGWTMTHAFFVQMGGFMACRKGRPVQVLTFDRLLQAIEKGEIDVPHIPEEDILDKSKGDGLSKLIIVLQTSWFVAQCIARWASHLPLAELEVLTLAFAVLNAYVYALWWSKPQGVAVPIKLELKTPHDSSPFKEENSTDATLPFSPSDHSSSIPLHQIHDRHISYSSEPRDESLPLSTTSVKYATDTEDVPLSLSFDHPNQDSSTGAGEGFEKESAHWMRHKITELDHSPFENACTFIAYLPFLILLLIQYPFRVLWKTWTNLDSKELTRSSRTKFKVGQLRVPMFYAGRGVVDDSDGGNNATLGLSGLFIPVIFGGIHLTLWSSSFPTPREQLLWRVAALYVTVEPIGFLASGLIGQCLGGGFFATIIFMIAGISVIGYAIARCILIFVSLYTLSRLSESVYQNVEWTTFIPHL
ncbi:hypothetical protein NP233_g3323 [Leucocoprinus birnbaumii]|uniref:Uncharacterized protein n=1 Tax=Leucocoprinus birnbaumii TaxID=56174 RepID=A0AAD5VX99_9AGAR|nr:hypothetical protein NP233_g3323 [Leucocoprinus birnbaumii]